MLGVIESNIPALRDDRRVADMLEASTVENISTVIHALRHDVDTATVEAPPSAVEYARRLAQRHVDVDALVRAYRLGQARFTRLFLEELAAQRGEAGLDAATTIRAVEQIATYVDRVVMLVLGAYDRERAAWIHNRSAVLAAQVHAVLEGSRVDLAGAEAALGYSLRQHHVGLVLWTTDRGLGREPLHGFAEACASVAAAVDAVGELLIVARDEATAWAWVPTRPGVADTIRAAVALGEANASVRVAIGAPAGGADGFRRTHRQALAAHAVGLAGGADVPRVVTFDEVAPIAAMCADLESTQAWVVATLGALAADSERVRGLRETTRVFLAHRGSFAAAAEQLFLHRNTVQYRVRQAEELRGRPFIDRTLDVEVALLACRWLGASVLDRG